MEQRSVSDLINQIEPLLKKFEGDDGLKITDAKEEAGCKLGDNYMSVVTRTKVKGSRGNGTRYAKSIVTKYFPHHREVAGLFKMAELFKNESYFYEKFLPILGNFGPICIHADRDKIIMEDLKPLGYVICDRLKLLDLDHSLATVKTLGRFHASSLALKLKDPTGFMDLVRPLKETIFPSDSESQLGLTIINSVKMAIAHLEWIQPRSEELEVGIQYLKSFQDKVYTEMRSLVLSGKGKYDVLTHGDAWNNNVMFKHDETGKILDVKLLDFQIIRHVSLAIDFHYFVYSSPKSEVIERNYDDLVKAYHSAFLATLSENFIPQNIVNDFTLEWFRDELKTYAKYGIFTACWIIKAILVEADEAIDMDKFTMEFLESYTKMELKIEPNIAQRLKCIVLDYVRRYVN